MPSHLQSGKFGENLAVSYLKNNGCDIIAVNWHYNYWEVDLVAKDQFL